MIIEVGQSQKKNNNRSGTNEISVKREQKNKDRGVMGEQRISWCQTYPSSEEMPTLDGRPSKRVISCVRQLDSFKKAQFLPFCIQ